MKSWYTIDRRMVEVELIGNLPTGRKLIKLPDGRQRVVEAEELHQARERPSTLAPFL